MTLELEMNQWLTSFNAPCVANMLGGDFYAGDDYDLSPSISSIVNVPNDPLISSAD